MAFFTIAKGKHVGKPNRDMVTVGKKAKGKGRLRSFYVSRNIAEALGITKGSRIQLDADIDNKMFRICKTDSPSLGRLVTQSKFGHTIKVNVTLPETVQDMLGRELHKCKAEVKDENGQKYVYFSL